MKITYLGPSSLRKTVISLLEKENNNYLFNTTYKSIEALENELIHRPDIKEAKESLSKLDLNIFHNALDDDGFINELIDIKINIIKYKVDINSLKVEKELKDVLKAIDIKEEELPNDNYSSYYVIDTGYDLFQTRIIEKIKENGAKLFSFNKANNKSYKLNVLNEAKEIETVAQMIIEKNLKLNDCCLILSSMSSKQLVYNVLDLYKIPYNQKPLTQVNKFISIIEYYLNKDLDSYRNVLNNNVLCLSNNSINEYLLKHINNKNDIYASLNKFVDDDKYFSQLEIDANSVHNQYLEFINTVDSLASLKDAFKYAFSLLEDSKEKDSISLVIQNYFESDINEENFENIKKDLLRINQINNYSEYLEITDLDKAVYNKKYLFVLDVTNQSFPGFKGLNGILHEYEIQDSNYPSANQRKDNLIARLDYLRYSEETYYFIPQASYDGKEQTESIYLNLFNPELITYDLKQREVSYIQNHEVDDELVKKELFKDNTLNGSISSFELYQKCKYKYFLTYVLGLRTEDKKELAPNTIGSIFHKLLEELIKTKGKEYYVASRNEIENIVSSDFDKLLKHYPNDSKLIDLSKHALIDTFLLTSKFFNVMENDTEYIPSKTEFMFKDFNIAESNNYKLNLKGFIDRIDEKDDNFRILDYKTHGNSLSPIAVDKGLQLQLLTYAYVYRKLSAKQAGGAYYVQLSPKINTEDKHFFKFGFKEGIVEVSENEYEGFVSSLRVQGAKLSEDDLLYKSNNCIKQKAAPIDYEKLETGLKTIYETILNSIVLNSFEIEPYKDACTYCDYKGICRLKNQVFERPIIYNILGKDGTNS